MYGNAFRKQRWVYRKQILVQECNFHVYAQFRHEDDFKMSPWNYTVILIYIHNQKMRKEVCYSCSHYLWFIYPTVRKVHVLLKQRQNIYLQAVIALPTNIVGMHHRQEQTSCNESVVVPILGILWLGMGLLGRYKHRSSSFWEFYYLAGTSQTPWCDESGRKA